jgi:serine/threonine protein kinase
VTYHPPHGTELVRRLGSGGVFDVALVRETADLLVCKRLLPRLRDEPAAHGALEREAKGLSLAQHPALPRLVRVGDDAQGPFVLETYIEGVSLRAVVEAWRQRGQPVPVPLAQHVAREALALLAELHELHHDGAPLGFVHGDLGPDNLLLGPTGQLRLIDLGACRFEGMDARLLHGGDRGTLPFVAPEVARGEASPAASHDVYALAATLLFVALSRPLVEASSEGALLLRIGERGLDAALVEEATGLGSEQRSALAAALSFEPEGRVSTARELLARWSRPSSS